ncbi:AraC family transcriptional regulator [Paenibacillus kribbensis]|uniref:AraC family transcriptional regulator n=1 Tax=Paenibacillus kribbensis TaxID=172713 RepID=UPI002DBE10AF|nr:AraC family transcriptional regulator [Paenibacillus kribbensis]MEC0234824.1 AraC family transcriptional regulator [Paenibacillus kribbensis]
MEKEVRKDEVTGMLRLKLRLMLKNKQTRLILLLTLCVSFVISGIGLLSYSRYREGLDTELNTPNIELLQINLDVTNRAFRESDNMALDAAYHPDVEAFARIQADGNSLSKSASIIKRLQKYLKALSSHEEIDSVEVISLENHALVSSNYGFLPDWKQAPDTTWVPWIQDIHRKPLLIKRRWYGTDPQHGTVELLSLARPIVKEGKVIGAVLINLDYDRFFSKLYIHLSNSQYVYDLEGELIYPKLRSSVPLNEMNRVLQELDVSPYAYVEIGDMEYMANQTFSDVTGWRLVSLVPMDKLLKNVKLARNMMLWLAFISILAGCSAVYYYNYAAFRPMKKINSLLNSGNRGTRQGGLYDLEPVISKLVGEFHRKSLVVERSLPELRSKYIEDVIQRRMGIQEMRMKWEQYFSDWEGNSLVVMVVSTDRYSTWAASFPEEDAMLLKYALNNILLETLEPCWKAVSAPDEESGFVVLLQFGERAYEAGTEAAVQEGIVLYKSVDRLIQVVGEHLPLTISIGVGHVVKDIQEARESYVKGKEALNLRLYEGYGRSHTNMDCDVYVEKDGSADVLLQEQTRDSTMLDNRRIDMIHTLESQEPGSSAKLIGQWVKELRLHRTAPAQVYLFVHELLEDLLEWCATQSVTPPDKLADYHWNQILTQDLQDIEALLVVILSDMEEKWNERRRSKDFVRVQEMMDYMEQHLHLNIGLQEIADQVHMSVSSVSSMFKEETGSTVYDYLTGLRMKKACALLCETHLKISEIADRVGYRNENSFIRVFRKHKQVTPGKFREISKYSNEYADRPKDRYAGVLEDKYED